MGLLREVLHVNDMYGYYAHLNLTGHDSHITLCGGFFSIMAKICIIGFLVLRLQIMFGGQGDENSSENQIASKVSKKSS